VIRSDSDIDFLYIVQKCDDSPVSKGGPGVDFMGMRIKSYDSATAKRGSGPILLLFADPAMSADDLRVAIRCNSPIQYSAFTLIPSLSLKVIFALP
jgi:hypothetical protein